MDFHVPGHLPVISSLHAIGVSSSNEDASVSVGGASAAWPSANLGIFIPFSIIAPYTVRTLWWANGSSVTGTVDCGIYSAGTGGAASKIVTATPTSQASTNVIQKVSITSVLLLPGSYYMGLSASSASATFMRFAPTTTALSFIGGGQQASVGTLPDSLTMVACANAYLPVFGFASQTTI